MKQRTRIYYSAQQKELMWEWCKKGDTLHDIGRFFDQGYSSIQGVLQEAGSIRSAIRKRSLRSLTLAEREVTSRGLAMEGMLIIEQRQLKMRHGKNGYGQSYTNLLTNVI